jgi:hypothetical protein
MNKIYLFGLLCLLISCNSAKDGINRELLDSVREIHVQNRTPDSFGGLEEYRIKDKKEIISLCNELLSLKQENNLQTRPYDGTIVIEFMRRDRDGVEEYINILSTGIILKPNSEYFITNSRGQYVSNHFLARILKYLEIDESKVSALDEYRKSKKEN